MSWDADRAMKYFYDKYSSIHMEKYHNEPKHAPYLAFHDMDLAHHRLYSDLLPSATDRETLLQALDDYIQTPRQDDRAHNTNTYEQAIVKEARQLKELIQKKILDF